MQWVVSGYALTFGLVLVVAGRLGDLLGRRRMFLIALSAFVVTSGLCGAAPSMAAAIAARLLQGVAGGMLIPQNSGLIQDLFRGAERGRAFGMLGTTVGLSTAAGPVIGGLILTAFPGPDGWRWVFYVNLPIGVIALLLAARLVPSSPRGDRRDLHLDLVGVLLLGAGVLSLLLPLVAAESSRPGRLWPLLGLAALLFGAFAWWEIRCARQGRQPLLDPRLARTPGYAAGSGIALIYFSGFTGIWLVLAVFFQSGLGYLLHRLGPCPAGRPFAEQRERARHRDVAGDGLHHLGGLVARQQADVADPVAVGVHRPDPAAGAVADRSAPGPATAGDSAGSTLSQPRPGVRGQAAPSGP